MRPLAKKLFMTAAVFHVLLGLASCNTRGLPTTELRIIRSDGTEFTVNAEIADTPETRNHGFMERKKIPDGTGMIFVFERDQLLSFWMKNTPHPLSIAYIDSSGNIRDIFDMTPFSLSPIVGTASARYALEVPQGWFAKNGIKAGDRVDISQFR